MHRNVTAVYRTREVAERVVRALEDVGIQRRDIHVVPDPARDPAIGGRAGGGTSAAAPGGRIAGTGTGVAAPGGTAAAGREHPLHNANMLEIGAEDPAHTDRLHDLHLPEEDLRTYQHCVRRGDYVVSAEVDDDQVAKVQEVMRHPEAHDIDQRASEFRNEDLIAHSAGEGHMLNEERRARRLTPGDGDRYARIYERDRRLGGLGGV